MNLSKETHERLAAAYVEYEKDPTTFLEKMRCSKMRETAGKESADRLADRLAAVKTADGWAGYSSRAVDYIQAGKASGEFEVARFVVPIRAAR